MSKEASCLLFWSCVLTVCGCQKNQPAAPAASYDRDYLQALAAADEFCDAWRKGDLADGAALLTPRLKSQHPERHIADAITGGDNSTHVAYEVFSGERLGDGRFAFKVRLLRRFSGDTRDLIDGPIGRLVLQRDDAGVWRVDEFPIPKAVSEGVVKKTEGLRS